MAPAHSLEPDVRTASLVGAGAAGAVALGEGRIKKLVIDELEVGVLGVPSSENLAAE